MTRGRIGILCGEISLDEAPWYIMSNLGGSVEWSGGERGGRDNLVGIKGEADEGRREWTVMD